MGWTPATGRAGHRAVAAFAALLTLMTISAALPAAAAASNPIVLENQQPGTSAWDMNHLSGSIATDGGGQIKGYADAVSVNKGQSITFHVSVAPAQTYTIDVYRIGWYQGLGGRLMQHIGPLSGTTQPTCPTDSTTGEIACNWAPTYTLATQTTWTSGVYEAILTNAASYHNAIIFVVRDDGRPAALLYQQPVNTYQAYNDYPDNGKTGKSLYEFNSYGANTVTGTTRAAKVSFDRPYQDAGYGDFEEWEINFVRWMEKNGYDVAYSTDVDTDTNGAGLLNHRGFLSVGHNEYWSKNMYDAAISALAGGVNLGFFGANAIYWQVRYEPSASGVADRVLVCYKDASIDPTTDPSTTTVQWGDPILKRPEQSLIGVMYDNQTQSFGTYIPYVVTNSSDWIYAGTGFKNGDSVPGLVGYEADQQSSSYPFPNAVPGTYLTVSNSPFTNIEAEPDHANSSIYQAPSGAWVFGAGTIGWSLGLDNYVEHSAVDPRIQQTTANILNRFSQPLSPTVVTEAASLITRTSATLNATVNPNGGEVSECKFEYGTTTSYGSSAPCASSPPSGTSPVAVSAALTGLTANTAYHFRISATNAGGTSKGSDQSFRTLLRPPMVLTAAASSITQNSATLNATVNPEGREVGECKFEYGPTMSYGASAPCSSLPGSGENPVAVSSSLTGLSNKTTYHFRISATSLEGTGHGSDQTFTAASPHIYKNGVMQAEGKTIRTIAWGTLKLTNSTLGEVECHSVWASYLENPTGGGAAVGKVQAVDPYECVGETCKSLGGTAIEVTAEGLPWSAEVTEPQEAVFRMRTGNRTKAAGAVFVRVNCVGESNAQFLGEDAPKVLNNGLSIGAAPDEEEFDQPGSGELESEALGGGKFAGKVKAEGYGAEELIEVKGS